LLHSVLSDIQECSRGRSGRSRSINGRRALLGILLGIGWSLSTAAADAVDPARFIGRFGDQAVMEIRKDATSQAQMRADFRTLLENDFDMAAISKLVLVRYWRTASDAEFAEFIKLFEQLLAQTYAARLSQTSGGIFDVVQKASDWPDPGDTIVTSHLGTAGEQPLTVEWYLKNEGGHFRIFDVRIESVSMVDTFRDEFASLIQSSGGKFAGLNDALRRKVAEGEIR
jgi:phospholipid transport system substrate-binding protein